MGTALSTLLVESLQVGGQFTVLSVGYPVLRSISIVLTSHQAALRIPSKWYNYYKVS